VGAGVLAGIMLLVYRARLAESIRWWRGACERERRLRDFAAVAASDLGEVHLVDTLAARFLESFGSGLCTIALCDGRFRVVAVAGADPLTAMRLKTVSLPPESTAAMLATVRNGRVMVNPDIDPAVIAERQRALGIAVPSRAAVVLPLTVEDVVAGTVVLVAPEPRAFHPDDVALWEAMARQAGVALANARLLGGVQRALRAKNAFLNTMSHELRTPLHVIAGYADMLRDGTGELPPAHLGDRIRANTLDLLHLVENTMNVARLDAGAVSLELDDFSPQELVAELAEDVRALPEAKRGVPIAWAVGADLPVLRLDRLKCKEIVRNLVSNALKFTDRGAVSVALERDDDHLRIAVQDTGRGIPPEAQRQIFDVFERIEEPSGRPVAGVGLGLYIVKCLVRLMRGDVRVTSRPGAGTTFTVRLPLRLTPATV
jgi:signal transduction histidine kinase